jgi:peptidoglycan/xylan/chitin deacetylase (PgdA/CDA1 family)
MRLLRWSVALSAAGLGAARGGEPGDALGPVRMESYAQAITVRFRSSAEARRARVTLAPLYHDLRLAFSTRMDDSTLNDLVVPGVMARYGQRGTFYLNRLTSWYQDSPATGIAAPRDPAGEIPPRLLAGGSSIGGHTLSHEFLPSLSKNDAFREIMGVRAALESRAATPVNSFVYPFVAYRESDLRGGLDRLDLEEMLRRSGYYQLAEHRYNADRDSGLQDAVFITLDNGSEGGVYTESALTRDRPAGERPLFLVTMHAWVKVWGAPDFPNLAAIYAKWSGRQDWWYCNQNQYAAYRYQALHSRISAETDGATLRVALVRPDPLDLDDWVPLTLRVEGVPADAVLSVECPGADVAPVGLGGGYAFDLSHDRLRGAIETYGESDNPGNADRLGDAAAGAEGLRALLYRRGGVLNLTLRNDGARPLNDLRVIFRLPLRWREGVVRRRLQPLGVGQTANLEVALAERADPAQYSDGPEFDAAQIDFVGGRRARVYATCEAPGGEPPAFFARNGFWILGPLAGDEADFDPLAFAKPLLEGAAPQREYEVHWSGRLAWRALEPSRASILDPDIIPTTAKANVPRAYVGDSAVYFPHANAQYVLYGRIVSPDARRVRAVFRADCVRRLSLNGRNVDGAGLDLARGANDVRILYAPAQREGASFDEGNYGCYFRLADGEGRRVADVRFERPPIP